MGAIRLYLALCVAYSHVAYRAGSPFAPGILGGYEAVLIFYIISGFYMAMVYNETYAKLPQGKLKFYLNRALRIYPTYWAVLIVAIALHANGYRFPEWYRLAEPVISDGGRALQLIDNALLIPGTIVFGLFTQPMGLDQYELLIGREALLFGQCFTLGVELFFYALAPLLVVLRGRRLAVLFLVFLVGHVGSGYVISSARIWQYEFFPGVLAFFLAGVVSYRVYLWVQTRNWKPWVPVLLLLTGAAICNHWNDGFTNTQSSQMLYLSFLILTPFLFLATRSSAVDRALGDLSFPVYVNHVLVIAVLFPRMPPEWNGLTKSLCALGASLLAAAVMRIIIELPIEQVRRKLAGRMSHTVTVAPAH